MWFESETQEMSWTLMRKRSLYPKWSFRRQGGPENNNKTNNQGAKAYGEVTIWFHLFLNSALHRIIGQLHAFGQSAPVCIVKHAGGHQSCPLEKRNISCPFRHSKHVSWDVIPFILVTIPTELLIITSLSVCVFFLARQPSPQWVMASSFTRFLDHT
jgi:hypothetical protein